METFRLGITGFCWGGRITWLYSAHSKRVKAGVAWYGRLTGDTSHMTPQHPYEIAASLNGPVLGLYGGNDQRVNATIPVADSTMRAIGGRFTSKVYEGAGHGFLRAQEQPANLTASQQAWPETIAFFREVLRGGAARRTPRTSE